MKNKPFKKAYKIIHCIDCSHTDNDEYIVYAETSGKAKSKIIRESEGSLVWSDVLSMSCRRFKENDLYKQSTSKMLIELPDNLIVNLTHSLGVCINDEIPKEFYRNYSMYYSKHKGCEKLVKLGLMENWKKLDSEIYGVTAIGIEAVKTLLLIKMPT